MSRSRAGHWCGYLGAALATLSSGVDAEGVITSVDPGLLVFLRAIVVTVIVIVIVYTCRHVVFTLNRLFARQRHPYLDVDSASWPSVTVIVPARNEQEVIGTALEALIDVDYPADKYVVFAVDDRSTDATGTIINEFATRAPNTVRALHRSSKNCGKAAVLKAVSSLIESEIIIIFDADYVPGRGLIKQLAAPFFDAEVGAVMGRVVPHNTSCNLLTRLLDLERAGGYQVDQQARMNLHLVPQFGGSVGGVRVSALKAVGGWRTDSYAEDTDLTYRLLLHGFKTVYENRCECYEEVPEVWQERNRQIMRWAKGHNQVAIRYTWRTLVGRHVGFFERVDALLLLGVYLIAPLLLLGFIAALGLYLLGQPVMPGGFLILVLLVCFSSMGNYAAFFEMAAAMHLDNSRRRLRLLPFTFFNFLASAINITRACASLVRHDMLGKRQLHWEKTGRRRRTGTEPSRPPVP